MRLLTPRVHGILDYAAVAVLMLAPFWLRFDETNVLALYLSVVLGLGLLLYSLITDYTYSVSGAVSFKIHLAFDAIAGTGLIAAPFIFGFEGAARIYYIVMGAGVLAVVALTDAKVSDKHFKAMPSL
jgi:hypothetical protein